MSEKTHQCLYKKGREMDLNVFITSQDTHSQIVLKGHTFFNSDEKNR